MLNQKLHEKVYGVLDEHHSDGMATENLTYITDQILLALFGDEQMQIVQYLDYLMELVHRDNARWWRDPATGQFCQRNVGEMLMLTVSELAEAMEGHRKGLADDHLPEYDMFTVEIADAMIRLLDMAKGMRLQLPIAFAAKMAYNRKRLDHTDAARLAPGGKKY